MRLILPFARRLEAVARGESPQQQSAGGGGSSASNCDCEIERRMSTWPTLRLRDCEGVEKAELFSRKLEACCFVFDFTRDSEQNEKDTKTQTLLELVDFAKSSHAAYNEATVKEVVDMVGKNIFRTLRAWSRDPAGTGRTWSRDLCDPGMVEDEPCMEIAWPHLQLVYEFFLQVIASNSFDPKKARRSVDQQLVGKLIDLFNSEDQRERSYLKTILHRIYGKFMTLRAFIRRSTMQVFLKLIHDTNETHNGISELLEVVGSIANGFVLPLKDEHIDFLNRALIPLHKVKSLATFSTPLLNCVSQYLEKDCRLVYTVIMQLLRFWPVSGARKQVLFLNEVCELLELATLAEIDKVQLPLFRRLAMCIESSHFQVAERALLFWNDDHLVRLINRSRRVLFPVVLPAVCRNFKHHWSNPVRQLSGNVAKLMTEADKELFEHCLLEAQMRDEEDERVHEIRQKRWKALKEHHDAIIRPGPRTARPPI